MMCQRNCGSTVQRALETVSVPNLTIRSAQASFATRTATVEVQYQYENDRDTDDIVLSDDILEEFVDAVECVGFDCAVLSLEEYEKLVREPPITASVPISASASIVTEDIQLDLELGDFDYTDSSDIKSDTYHAILSVAGMSCAVCVGRVEGILMNATENVLRATVVLATGKAKVMFQRAHGRASDDDLSTDEHAGFISKSKQSLSSSFIPEAADIAQRCADAVSKGGYECHVLEVIDPRDPSLSRGISLQENAAQIESIRQAELAQWKYLFFYASSFTVPLVAIHLGLFASQFDKIIYKEFLMLFLATPVQFCVGQRFYVSAFKSLKNGIMGMDFLVAMGTSAAYLYSMITFILEIICGDCNGGRPATFETSAMLLTFVAFGKYLEAYAKGKTANALQTLMELQPTVALRANREEIEANITGRVNIHSLQTEEVSIGGIKTGDYLVVLPGSRIPTDGVIIAREGDGKFSYIDESALSGEPFPVAKGVGDTVYGSCVNQLSVILMQVTATGGDTFLARIVRLIEDAQANKAPIQAIADQVASIFAPIVMILSAVTFIVWSMIGSGDTHGAFYSALMSAISVIVIACPCALGLATPTAVMVGTGVGAKLGLLIKGGAVLEKTSTIKTIVFDKTGTLTTGRAILGGNHSFVSGDDTFIQYRPNDVSIDNFALWVAACAESCSEHPLGKAICNTAKSKWGSATHGAIIDNFIVEPGNGVECTIKLENRWEQRKVRVGTKTWTSDELSR